MDGPAAELGIEDLDAASGPDLGSEGRFMDSVSGNPPWDLVSEVTEHSFENFEVVDDASSQSAFDYNCERELDRSWVQLSNKPLQHFWETGFWGRLFGTEDADSLSEALTRPAIVPEPPELVQASVSSMSSPRFSLKRSRAISFLDVVTNTSEQSRQEQRDATWETAIRRWHSCIITWEGEDPIINIIRSKEDFRSQCQIIVDVLHNKAQHFWSGAIVFRGWSTIWWVMMHHFLVLKMSFTGTCALRGNWVRSLQEWSHCWKLWLLSDMFSVWHR